MWERKVTIQYPGRRRENLENIVRWEKNGEWELLTGCTVMVDTAVKDNSLTRRGVHSGWKCCATHSAVNVDLNEFLSSFSVIQGEIQISSEDLRSPVPQYLYHKG